MSGWKTPIDFTPSLSRRSVIQVFFADGTVLTCLEKMGDSPSEPAEVDKSEEKSAGPGLHLVFINRGPVSADTVLIATR